MSKERLGDLMHELEDLMVKFVEGHDLQRGEILGLVNQYLTVHYPGCIEEYEDGSCPNYFYGPIESMMLLYKDRLKEYNDC